MIVYQVIQKAILSIVHCSSSVRLPPAPTCFHLLGVPVSVILFYQMEAGVLKQRQFNVVCDQIRFIINLANSHKYQHDEIKRMVDQRYLVEGETKQTPIVLDCY